MPINRECKIDEMDAAVLEVINMIYTEALKDNTCEKPVALMKASMEILTYLSVPYAIHREIPTSEMLYLLYRVLKEKMGRFIKEMAKEAYH